MKFCLAAPHSYPGLVAEISSGGDGQIFLMEGSYAAMKVFMAGGITGNLNPLWRGVSKRIANGESLLEASEKEMRVFMADAHTRPWVYETSRWKEDEIKAFLAGVWPWRNEGMYDEACGLYRPYILESFFYCNADTERLLPYFGDFLLDSGAFTFMSGNGGAQDWDGYVERYADFINRHKIQKFFELDIDVVVGYERVKALRKRLERLTGAQCIPVWHRSRGHDDFKRMCDEYSYVAIGGIVSGEIKSNHFGLLPRFIEEAHKRKAKIHGLGFTALDWLKRCHFDSVDSTAWTTGNRFGFIYWFDGKTMQKKLAPKGHRLRDARKTALNNYIEWLKFQRWADTHL